jgi:aryl-alcohol dehydrogenase-like predicted oxidoreductase
MGNWHGTRFALGLLEIGRAWGHIPGPVPDERQAVDFLRHAFLAGVRVFDTAPSYAYSEQRFGLFLRELTAAERASVTVATKFGEDWDFQSGAPLPGHSYDALMRSLDRSCELLGRIDILQVHKSTTEVLRSADLSRALDEALTRGIGVLGASLKDMDTARAACADPRLKLIQIPFNRRDRAMVEALRLARATGRLVFTNRPFGMGELVDTGAAVRECIAAILAEPFDGAILFGTRSVAHLNEDLAAFEAASAK